MMVLAHDPRRPGRAPDVVQVWMILVLAFLLGMRQRRRHAGPPGVRGRDGRPRGHRQRRRAQLGDVQRARGSSARPSAGLAIGAFGVATAFAINAVELPRGHRRRCSMMRRAGAQHPPRDRPARRRSGRVVTQPARGPPLRPRGRRSCCSPSSSSGSVATVGMNFSVLIPAYAQDVAPVRRRRLRVPDGGVRRRLAAGRADARRSAVGRNRSGSRAERSSSACRRSRLAATRRLPDRAGAHGPHRLRLDPHGGRRATRRSRLAVPDQLRGRVMSVVHDGLLAPRSRSAAW